VSSRATGFTLTTVTTMQDEQQSNYAGLGLGKDRLPPLLPKVLVLRRFEEKIEELFLVKGASIILSPTLGHVYMPSAERIVETVGRIVG
jgi:hypothetical protein